jgi:hypothetical protein
MSHRCLHRRFSHAAAIESNESRGPLRAFKLVNLSRTAIEQLAESKAEKLHCRLSFRFHSIETATDELVSAVMYRHFLFFKSLPFISAVILCSAVLSLLVSIINN